MSDDTIERMADTVCEENADLIAFWDEEGGS